MSSNDVNPKIIDLIKSKEAGSKPFVSIEFFPPRTDDGVKVRRMNSNDRRLEGLRVVELQYRSGCCAR